MDLFSEASYNNPEARRENGSNCVTAMSKEKNRLPGKKKLTAQP